MSWQARFIGLGFFTSVFCFLGAAIASPNNTPYLARMQQDTDSEKANSQSEIAGLIASRCLSCHSGDTPESEIDLSRPSVLVNELRNAGKLEESPLWAVIRDDEMPPDEPLSDDEKQTFRDWLSQGAPTDFEPIARWQFSTDNRAGYDWWSLQPLKSVGVPQTDDPSRIRSPIDACVLPRLKDADMNFSLDAEPRDQIRRLYVDLVGLPAPWEVIEAFENDPTEAAYAKIVDQLLASPEYGERWARNWLDIVRYGESDGFERNGPRGDSWRYRDWVIDAFNSDMPFDEFARRQVAGDILCEDPIEGMVATGFLVAGVHNTVVGSSKSMQLLARQDELEDLVGNIGQTFVGLTFNCARCHDHKFDPITQHEYYQLVATASGINHGVRESRTIIDEERLANLAKRIRELHAEVQELEEPVRKKLLAQRLDGMPNADSGPAPLFEWDFNHPEQTAGTPAFELLGDARITSEGLTLDGNGDFARTGALSIDLTEKTLETWIHLDDLDQQGGAAISVETLDGSVFDAIVFAERESKQWMAGSNGFSRTRSFGGTTEDSNPALVHIAITYRVDGTITAYRNGVLYGTPYSSTGPQTFAQGDTRVLFGLRHSSASGNRFLKGSIVRARLYDRALSADEIAHSAVSEGSFISQQELLVEMSAADLALREKMLQELSSSQAELDKLQQSSVVKCYTATFSVPGETFFLPRGDVMMPGAVVTPGTTAAIPNLEASFANTLTRESDRRLKLVEWVTNPQNPLFHRVIVNRLWHYHFGRGLVATPNDLGFNGGFPSHPELLDWLAGELKNSGYHLKPLHRLIVLSTAYRQSSQYNATAAKQDSDNRWLWRKTPMRLDAEVVRDGILQVSGRLNATRGGPGYQDVEIIDQNNGTTYYESFDRDDSSLDRRTIYRFTPRGGRSALLDSLDCPDPSAATPRRSVTTTPLQALSLLNNDFMLRMSEAFSQRAQMTAPHSPSQQIDWMFRNALGREPAVEEKNAALQVSSEHGLAAVARALFNCNEFIIVQ